MNNSSKKDDITMLKTECDWMLWQARELEALFSYDSKSMIKQNKVRALSDIESIRISLSKMERYIKGL